MNETTQRSLKFGVLTQKNELYRDKVWSELDDLYEGGYAVSKKAEKYLPRLVGEAKSRHEERRRSAGYIGYLGMIIDRFVAALFMEDIIVTEPGDATDAKTKGGTGENAFWVDFAKDADFGGTPFSQMMRTVMSTALLKGKAVVAIDFPTVDATEEGSPSQRTRAEEEAAGTTRGYLVDVPPEQLVDWKLDRFGNFEWAILYRLISERATPGVMRDDAIAHEFKVWSIRDGVAVWEIYRFVEARGRKPLPDTDVPLMAEGVTSFTKIPLISITLKKGLWVGNICGPLQKEHHQRRACLVAGMNRSLVAIPIVKLGSEIGSAGGPMPAEVSQNANRGDDPVSRFQQQGYVVIGAQDDITFAEPTGGAYEITRSDLSELKDEMFRVVHQMAASLQASQTQQGASGDSKREDREAECVVLTALGAVVRDVSKQLYTMIALARNENVEWVVHGLDQFESDDRVSLLAEAVQIGTIAIRSDTFKKEYQTRLAMKLLESPTPAVQETIRQEIDAGVKADAEMDGVRREAEKKQLLNPEPLGGAGAGIAKKPALKA